MKPSQLLRAALAKVGSASIRAWATSPANRKTWLKITKSWLDQGNPPDADRLAAYIMCVHHVRTSCAPRWEREMGTPLRLLKDDEVVEVGDVFQMFEGAYSTAIVTKVDNANGVWHVERVMQVISGGAPAAHTCYERMTISFESIRKNYKFYRRSEANKDNRWYYGKD